MNKINFVGYNSYHDKDFEYDFSEGGNFYLLLFVNTPAIFYINEEAVTCPVNTAILYPPNAHIHYKACGEYYSDCWLRFNSNEAFVEDFPLIGQPFNVSEPEYIESLLKLITWETSISIDSPRIYQHSGIDFFSTNQEKESASYINQPVIDDLLRILFKKLHECVLNKSVSTHETELLILRRKIANSPELAWNVPDIARELNLSEGHLQALYKQQFGISVMDDIINFRLKKAEDYLMFSNHSIATIAEDCGYNSHEHFSRQFKSRYGLTPGEYRKKQR